MDLIGERFTAGLLQATSAVGNLIFTGLWSILPFFFLYFFLLILFVEHLQRNLIKKVPLLTPSTFYTQHPFWDLCVANGLGPGLGRALCAPTVWHGESILESLASGCPSPGRALGWRRCCCEPRWPALGGLWALRCCRPPFPACSSRVIGQPPTCLSTFLPLIAWLSRGELSLRASEVAPR